MSQYPANSPFGFQRQQPLDYSQAGTSEAVLAKFFNGVYAWMASGLAVTALVAYLVARNFNEMAPFFTGGAFWVLVIVELGLVFAISYAINKIPASIATAMFMLYAALNGLTLAGIFLLYTNTVIATTFIITAATFGAMSLYGFVTKRDLTTVGRLAFMALIGIIIASIVNIFVHASGLALAIDYIGVLVFVVLTAYDTQKLKAIAYQTQGNPALAARLSIIGSLMLYLDFINLFLLLLQLMGDRRR